MKKIFKGVKKAMATKINECKEILSDAQNRLILGLMLTGLGIGLVASAYLTTN